jgi:hypothetical protein
LATVSQRNFSSGELSPSLYSRVDITKYATGLRTCKNNVILRYGGATNRSGTKFINVAKYPTKDIRLIDFQFNDDQTYMLQFGENYIWVSKYDPTTKSVSVLTEASKAIVSSTTTTELLLEVTGHGLSTGDNITIITTATTGAGTEIKKLLDERIFQVEYIDADNIRVKDIFGAEIDCTGYNDISTADIYKIYEVSTPYAEADLEEIKYIQSADVITLVHKNHAPRELTRLGDTNWTLSTVNFLPDVDRPFDSKAIANGTHTLDKWYRYKVTAIDAETGEESLPATADLGIGIRWIFNTNPCYMIVTMDKFGADGDIEEGDEIILTGISGMTELNDRTYNVKNLRNNITHSNIPNTDITTDTFTVNNHKYRTGQMIFLTGAGVASTGLTASRPYYIVEETINTFKLADTLPLAVAGTTLTWTAPSGVITTDGYDQSLELRDIDATNYSTFVSNSIQISSVDIGTEKITANNHNLVDTQRVEIYSDKIDTPAGITPEVDYFVIVDDANTIRLATTKENALNKTAVDITDVGASIQPMEIVVDLAYPAFAKVHADDTLTVALSNTVSWELSENAVEYNIYKEANGVYGQIGFSNIGEFTDTGFDIDFQFTPPIGKNPFVGTGNYPRVVTYNQQRLCYANTLNDTEKIWLSRIGNFKNFTGSSPTQDSDSISFNFAGRQVNSVQNMVDIGKLIVLTTGGEWAVEGDVAGVIRPTDINSKQYSYNGSAFLSPIAIDGVGIYLQARSTILRDLAYDFQVDGYQGNDLTLFSAHLFDKFTIVDMAYQQVPNSILWAVRSDGVLLGLTYVKNQQVLAWHRHDLGGKVKRVSTVSEGSEDVVYVVVERTINKKTANYIERLSTRLFKDIREATFSDSFVSYDGRNTDSNHTIRLEGGTTWAFDETLTATSNLSYFVESDVGNSIFFTSLDDGEQIRFIIDSYVSDTQVTGRPHRTVPADDRTEYNSSWGMAVPSVSNLWHMEGEKVSALGDGFVIASPNNDSYDQVKVTNGIATFDKAYEILHIGLPYISDLETLDIDSVDGVTISDKKINISKIDLHLEETRGLWLGIKPPSDDSVDPLEDLAEFKMRNNEPLNDPIELFTGVEGVVVKSNWTKGGRIFVRQVDPLPSTILGIHPAGLFPFT